VVVTVLGGLQRKSAGAALALALALAAVGPAACGGTDKGRPPSAVSITTDAGDPDTSCNAAANLTLQSITDFEPAPGSNPKFKPTSDCAASLKSSGCMYYNYDTEQSPRLCTVTTPSFASCVQADGAAEPYTFCMTANLASPSGSVDVTQIPDTRCGASNYAFHLAATNLAACYDPTTKKQGWGATLQLAFAFDGSTWDGVSLWVRRGSASSASAFFATIQDRYTVKAAGCLADPTLEPANAKFPPKPDAEKCDPFGLGVGLTDNWRLVKIPFADTHQKGFGVPSPTGALDASSIQGMQLVFSPGDWDVWIDDIAFYHEPS
jgi:hypothetical protein